jgi:hypothetical protein
VNTVTGSTGFLPTGMVGRPPRQESGSLINKKPAGRVKFRSAGMAAGIRNLITKLAADKNTARGNDAVFSTHQNVKKIPVTAG